MKIKIFLPFLFLLILSGCLNYTQVTTIKTDGTGNMFIHYSMKWNNQRDSIMVEQLGIFNKDSVSREFTSQFSHLTNVEIYKDKDSTVHTKVELYFNSLDSLNRTPAFRKSQLSVIDGSKNIKIFSQLIPPIATGFGFGNQKFIFTFVYYLPGEILSHNATEIYRNRLTWKYSIDEVGMGKYITATYRPFKLKETPVWIYIIALFVLSIVIVYLFSKKIK